MIRLVVKDKNGSTKTDFDWVSEYEYLGSAWERVKKKDMDFATSGENWNNSITANYKWLQMGLKVLLIIKNYK